MSNPNHQYSAGQNDGIGMTTQSIGDELRDQHSEVSMMRIFVAIAFLFVVVFGQQAQAAVAFVSGQSVKFIDYTGATYATKTVSLPGNWTAGNMLLVQVTNYRPGTEAATAVDSGTNSAVGQTAFNTNSRLQYWVIKNLSGTPTANITVTFTGTPAYIVIEAWEISGQDTGTQPDVAAAGQQQNKPGTSTDLYTSGNITTVTNGALIAGTSVSLENFNTNASVSAGTGYTGQTSQLDGAVFVQKSESKTQATAGSVAATFTYGVNDRVNTQVIAIRPSAASAPSLASCSVTSQTTAQYSLGCTVTPNGASTTWYAVARDTSLSAATCTQIKASQDSSGGAAIAAANSGTGMDGAEAMDLGGSLTRLKHSIDMCPSNSAGDGSVTTLASEQLDCASGYNCITLASVSPTSWLADIESPAVAAGDVVEHSQTFSPDGDTWTVGTDGDWTCTPAVGEVCTEAEKTGCYRIDDASVGNWMTGTASALCASTRFALVLNNPTPVYSPPSDDPVWRVNTAMTEDVCAMATDDDTLTGTNSSTGTGTGADKHPAGTSFGGTGDCVHSGTPTTAATGSYVFTVTDTAGATATLTRDWEVRPELETPPNCVTLDVNVCGELLEDAYLVEGAITRECSDETPGEVLSQSETGDVEPGTEVDLVVAKRCRGRRRTGFGFGFGVH